MEDHSNERSEQQLAPRQNQSMRRDFGGTSMMSTNAATEALVAKARADIEARWVMAMHRPRNMDNVRQDILRECKRPGFADVAVYERPVGRKYNEATGEWEEQMIEGLSIRFAEVAARCMTNFNVETETIYDTESERRVRVRVTDLECNGTWHRDLTVSKTVERRRLKKGQNPIAERVNSYGDRVFIVEATDDEVNVKEAASVSKSARTLILRLVPGHLQDEALAVCKKIAADRDAKDPDSAKNKVLDAFASLNVRASEIEAYLGHATDRITPAETERLRKLYIAISEGEADWQATVEDAISARATKQPRADKPAGDKPADPASSAKKPGKGASSAKKPGKGAAAVKDQLKGDAAKPTDKPAEKPADKPADKPAATKPEPAAKDKPAEDPREKEPGWMASKAANDQPQPTTPPKEGFEDRSCARCQVPIEVPKNAPAGAKCYSCSSSE